MPGSFDAKTNIVNYSAQIGEINGMGKLNNTEALSLALMSVFDKSGKNSNGAELPDGKVTSEEFSKVSEEQYNNYVAEMKDKLSKEEGKESVKTMNVPTYKEYSKLVKNGDVDFAAMQRVVKVENIEDNPFDGTVVPVKIVHDRLEGAAKIVAQVNFDDMPAGATPEKMIKNIVEGKDKDFNKSCVEADNVFNKFDKNRDDVLSVDEQDKFKQSTPDGAKAAEIFKAADETQDGKLTDDEANKFFENIHTASPSLKKELLDRYYFNQPLGGGDAADKTRGEVISDIYDDKRRQLGQ